MIALCCWCDTVSVVIPAGDESARPDEGLPAPNSPADAARNPAQVSFWLLEPVADAAMTYFYAQLFAMDTEIRAMFPARRTQAGTARSCSTTARGGTRTCTTCPD